MAQDVPFQAPAISGGVTESFVFFNKVEMENVLKGRQEEGSPTLM